MAEALTIIADTAHLPNMERPSHFNRLVLDFLERIGKA
jgi:pimeloyl-ACP methyl ester carboxylesterase